LCATIAWIFFFCVRVRVGVRACSAGGRLGLAPLFSRQVKRGDVKGLGFKAPSAWVEPAVAKPKLTTKSKGATSRFLQPVAFKIKGSKVRPGGTQNRCRRAPCVCSRPPSPPFL
jgi:hypothetical protein